ncbi:secreted PhoX family phosphatase [Sphingobium xenophagum]|uniref:Secreted PhoX family phosphatase n=1 Tax=Sphingobium xenophagum TaxID=121428 RepID=A0ABU1X0U8_SPHXE|nr:alkaline phosphatase PhoX [Sphingobium xenophagum]MDR7154801.1 secreted PhoX family phosphatase [Sphingobium xenophagum]
MDRRRFTVNMAAALGGLAVAGCAQRFAVLESAGITASGYGPTVADPAGLIDLPAGFSYRVISQFGDRMSDGLVVPDRADGMGCFALPGGRHALVRNHELAINRIDDGALRGGNVELPAFDRLPDGRALPGGTTTIILDNASGQMLSQHLSLAGTIRNCAGGATPWGSWLTCEEDVTRAGNGVRQDHGWVFEVPAAAPGLAAPQPIRAMGRFNHEAAAVDPRTGIVYLTEDRDDSLLYRFLPEERGQMVKGGRLQALALLDPARTDSRNWIREDMPQGEWLPVRWIDLHGTDAPDDDLRFRGNQAGALRFARGEGIHWGDGELFFCCTSGGAAKLGQIMRLRPGPPQAGRFSDRLQLFVESRAKAMLDFGDNLTVAPTGHLVVCEDQYTKVVANRLIGVTPAGATYVLGALNTQTELAGACFSPDGRTLYVNAYSPAKTLAITGPWQNVVQ